jgi:amino acid adenylation domain-containing protein
MTDGAAPLSELSPEQRRELLRAVLERKAQKVRTAPLSLGQEALWFLDKLEPNRPTYGFYPAVRLQGPLDLPALERAFAEVIRRHDSLRTTFPEIDGSPIQRVAPPTAYRLPVIDLSALPGKQRDAEVKRYAEERPPLSLQNGPLVRAQVLRLGPDDHVVVVHLHHIIFDGWSLRVFATEVFELYTAFKSGRPSPLPDLKIQYIDFATWQRKYLQDERLESLRQYWRKRLSGLPPLDLPTDFPRPSVRTSRGAVNEIRFSPEVSRQVTEFSRREHVTVFMTLLAAFQELLHRYSGQEDFAIGTPTANRRQKNLEPLIGYFINMLVMRADLSGPLTFRRLVQRVRDTALEAFQNQELTLDKITEAVAPARDLSRHPLFQVMFVVPNFPQRQVQVPDFRVTTISDAEPKRSAKFELSVVLRPEPGGIAGKINFNTDLFAAETIRRMAEHFQILLGEAVANPDMPLSRLGWMNAEERTASLAAGRGAELPSTPWRNVCELIEAQAARVPDAEAVVRDENRWTYGELNERASRLAGLLRRRGVGPEAVVGICLEREPELLMAILAVWKAGGAYVAIDPAYSQEARQRTRFVLGDANASLLITKQPFTDGLGLHDSQLILLDQEWDSGESLESVAAESPARPDNLAYILYTSGSTGRPKGVMVTQGNLLNALAGWEHAYRLTSDLTCHLQMASFGFDVFAGDLVRALGSGGKLVICPKEVLLSPDELYDLMQREGVDAAEFVPVVLRNLVHRLETTGESLDFMRLVAVGSDAWYAEDHRRTLQVVGPGTRVVNSYGLTEATIDSCYFEGDVVSLPPTGIVPIGRPFPNVQLYVLDQHLEPQPIGIPGELYIGGAGVARGYVNRPDLDSERYVKDPFDPSGNGRLCRTGDRARWRNDGQLEFLGRGDDQVKIRGFRIEPGEIEEALRECGNVAEAAVVVRQRTPDDQRLVAYIVPQAGRALEAADIKRMLRQRLPDYMVPSAFVSLGALPTLASGKVDRRALPDPDWQGIAEQREYVAPATPTEQTLAAIWTDILGVERVGARDNFFDLGGNSLLAIRLVSRVRTEMSLELPLVALFAAPTLSELALKVGDLQQAARAPQLPAIRRTDRSRPLRVSFTQHQFWTVCRMFPGVPMSNMHATLPISGEIDLGIMRDTINEIIRRHENLRTTFTELDDGTPIQCVADELTVDLPVEDLRQVPESERMESVRGISRKQRAHVFDFGRLPLFIIRLLRLSDNEHVLIVTTNHIISDGWSLQLLIREVSEIYAAFCEHRPSPLPELQVQYADFCQWEHDLLQSETGNRLMEYWRDKLAGASNPELPTDRPRTTDAPHVQKKRSFRISGATRTQVESLARALDVTPFVVWLAAFKTLLARLSNSTDIAVAAPVANRNRIETHNMLGVFVNTLILRSDLSGNPSFREMVARVRATTGDAFDRQELPLTMLADAIEPDRDPKRFPLSQVMFSYLQRTTRQAPRRHSGLKIGYEYIDSDPLSTRLDLVLTIAERPHDMEASLKYDAAFFDDATIDCMVDSFFALVEGVIDNPDRRLADITLERTAPAFVNEPVAALRAASGAAGELASAEMKSLVTLRPADSGTPLFFIPGLGGHVASFFQLAQNLSADRPVYALQALGLDPQQQPQEDIGEMASHFLSEIRSVQRHGPYLLAGWSLGGVVALEMARQLEASGEAAALVALLDTHLNITDRDIPEMTDASVLKWVGPLLQISPAVLRTMTPEQQWELISERANREVGLGMAELRRLADVCKAQLRAAAKYRPQPYHGRAVLFRASEAQRDIDPRWVLLVPKLQVERAPGNHYTMLQPPNAQALAERLDRRLQRAARVPLARNPQ